MEIYARNAREALIKTAWAVLDQGAEVQPRGMLTREVEHLTVFVEDPADWSCAGINAEWSRRVVAVEALQLIGGFSDPAETCRRLPNFKQFLNDETSEFDGAYGTRVGRCLPAIVARLRHDVDTRQAVIPIYEPADTIDRPSSRDYPCTLSLHFLLRDDALNLHVTMRSNDVAWGLKHDMGQFMLLQCSLAQLLRVPIGAYMHTSNSMHLYARSFEWAEKLDVVTMFDDVDVPRGGVSSPDGSVAELQDRARKLFYGLDLSTLRTGFDKTDVEAYLRQAAQLA